jgi:NAD(P)-dependent dehydrogenase (short-subunit alcohol dehydrogenase family)
LGESVTNAFLKAGAKVAGVARKIQQSDFASPDFSAFPGDLSSATAAKAVVDAVVAKLGRIDTVVHLVGAFAGGQPVAETDDATLERMMNVNFRSAFYLAKSVLPGMRARGSGKFLAIGSRAAVEPAPMIGAYAASKAALVSLIRTLALENKDRGITANIVLPSTIDTAVNRAAMPAADFARWVDPAQVAAMLVHLASAQSSQVSGAVIPVYGGEL